jgi:hypothetical protein
VRGRRTALVCRVSGCPHGLVSRLLLTRGAPRRPEALQDIHAQLGKVAFMEQVFWDRKEGACCVLCPRVPVGVLTLTLLPPLTHPLHRALVQPTWSLAAWMSATRHTRAVRRT